MFFEYVFKDPTPFIKTIEMVKDVVDTVNFQFHGNEIEFQCMDNYKVSLSMAKFGNDCFTKTTNSGYIHKGLHLKPLFLCLKCYKPGDVLTLSSEEETSLVIGIKKSKINEHYTFRLSCVMMETDMLQIPDDIKYSCEFSMNSNDFTEIVKNTSAFGDTITFSNKEKSLDISGQDLHGSLMVSKIFSKSNFSFMKNTNVSLSTKYVQMFAKGNYISSEINVSLSEDDPVVFAYFFGDYSYLKFYLAPKYPDN